MRHRTIARSVKVKLPLRAVVEHQRNKKKTWKTSAPAFPGPTGERH
uniref:Uncharacterized protein n=1 Tax=Anopheles dirus TaxID=7168 RepID=A0A182NWB5_9DIPT